MLMQLTRALDTIIWLLSIQVVLLAALATAVVADLICRWVRGK